MAHARIAAVASYLPVDCVTYDEIGSKHPDWDIDKLSEVMGIRQLPRAAADEYSSDLATKAAKKLLDANSVDRDEVDYVLLVTQTPDYPLPTAACLAQDALGLRHSVGALDVRLGCSGYVYALGLARGLVESGQASCVLLLTADVMSKMVNPGDKSTAPVFGDAGTATLVKVSTESQPGIGPFVYGTDGAGAGALIVANGSLRPGAELNPESATDRRGLVSQGYDLYMDGGAVFAFTLEVVPPLVKETLRKAEWALEDVDLFVFHQANRFMIDFLRKRLRIPPDRFWIDMETVGNTGVSTIPLALSQACEIGRLVPGNRVLVAGFGVGLSWAGATLTW